MYECGLALQRDTPDTIIKVFTCDDSGPPQFEGRVLVKIKDRADVLRFTNDFLTDAEFFPDFGEKVAPGFNPNDSSVVSAASGCSSRCARSRFRTREGPGLRRPIRSCRSSSRPRMWTASRAT